MQDGSSHRHDNLPRNIESSHYVSPLYECGVGAEFTDEFESAGLWIVAICRYNVGSLPRKVLRMAQPKDVPEMSLYTRLRGKLGVSRIRSDRDLASLVEKRLSATVIKSLVRGGLSDSEVYRLIVPRRTLAHRIARQQPLSQEESDKAVRVARIAAMAEQVF